MGGIHSGQEEGRQSSPDLLTVSSPASAELQGGTTSIPLIACLDQDGTISSLTLAMAKAFGVDTSEAVGHRFSELVLPDDWDRIERVFRLAQHERISSDVRRVHPVSPTSGRLEMNIRVAPLEGVMSSVLLSVLDTEKCETPATNSSQEVAEQLFSWSDLVSIAVDKGRRVTTLSTSVEVLTGKTHQDMVGRDIMEILDPEPIFQSNFRNSLDKVFNGETRILDLRLLDKKGTVVQLRWRLQPIKNNEGKVAGAMGFGHELPSNDPLGVIEGGMATNLEVLAETSTDFVESEDLAKAMDKDLEKLIDSLGVDFAVFRLVGVESKPRMVCAGLDFRQGRTLLESHLVGEGPLYRGVQNGATFISLDAQTDPRLVLEVQGVRSLICLPIRFRGEIYGCGAFGSMRSAINFQSKLSTLQLFCNQVAISMRKAKLKAELTLKNKELESLYEISMAVSSSLDLKKVLSTILNRASDLVKADAAYLFQLDKNTATLDMISAMSPYITEPKGHSLRVGEGISGLVAQTREGMLIERADKDTRSVQVPGTPEEPSSLISVPLKMGEELLGVVTLERIPGVPFNENDFRLIQLFSFQAATALNNALMFNRLNEHASAQQMYNILLTHDVANYNVPIHGYLEMLAKDPKLDERQRRFVKSSLAQSENISSLIADVRKLSLLRTMEAVRAFEPIDLSKVIKEVIDSLSQNILYEDTEVKFTPPIENAQVAGDNFVKDIVYNLISNACKHAGDSPIDVVVKEYHEGNQTFWRMDVKDLGGGVPEDRKAFLFRRFENVDANSASEGHGIGLSVVSALCERFGGRVWVEDREQMEQVKGSIFTAIFPKVKV
ncbi:MAG: GAF domain-containing protein [Methanomassiliicoccales archaeon]|nr:GAF domain-containing protein [Methanomassiliicoccales archaeon]